MRDFMANRHLELRDFTASREPFVHCEMAMSGPSLHHAQVFYPAGREADARRFYGDALGLPEIERLATERAGLWFGAGDGQVHLSVDDDLGLHPRRHFALRVPSLDDAMARLRAAGAKFEDAAAISGWRRVYVFDPFGNKIELDQIDDAGSSGSAIPGVPL
jgi:catechol 2,3-dioxygenase-like lactoylglutathione lyase family enzyme